MRRRKAPTGQSGLISAWKPGDIVTFTADKVRIYAYTDGCQGILTGVLDHTKRKSFVCDPVIAQPPLTTAWSPATDHIDGSNVNQPNIQLKSNRYPNGRSTKHPPHDDEENTTDASQESLKEGEKPLKKRRNDFANPKTT
ncbi:hypothetical protein AaE_007185, partial [Aphanomyces astaci]